jgi:hypothetical protein
MNNLEPILYKALRSLEEKSNLQVRWYANLKAKDLDGKLELRDNAGKQEFPVIIKSDIRNTHLLAFHKIQNYHSDLLIVAETIFPAIREQLRKMNVNYLDGAGNCFIKKDGWFFLLDGFKTNETITPVSKDRAFSKAGLRLVFHFLCDPDYLNVTYRQMARDHKVSLGNIYNVFNSLKEQGYLANAGDFGNKLIDKKKLVDEWIMGYEQKLKPTLLMGTFRFLNGQEKEWQKIPLRNTETQWGGEPAANLLTNYLKPGKLTIYTDVTVSNLMKQYRLLPDEKATLSIYKRFWVFNAVGDTVPPLLIYADLINSGDPRNIETAERIYEQFLSDQF